MPDAAHSLVEKKSRRLVSQSGQSGLSGLRQNLGQIQQVQSQVPAPCLNHCFPKESSSSSCRRPPYPPLCIWNEYSLGVSRHCFSSCRPHAPLVSVLPMRQNKVQRQIGFLGEQVEISGFPCVHVPVSVGRRLGLFFFFLPKVWEAWISG